MEYHNPTLRVLRILELIDSNPNGLNLSEIADLLELPKGTISPILKTLSAKKYVDLEGMLYKIGPRLFQLGLSFASGTNALSLIRKEMHNIVAAVEEVCQMGVLSGTDVHYLLREDAKTVITIISGVGKRLPAHKLLPPNCCRHRVVLGGQAPACPCDGAGEGAAVWKDR